MLSLRPTIDTGQAGSNVTGPVVTPVPGVGAFVDIGTTANALVPTRALPAKDAAEVGQAVTAWITNINTKTQKIALSMRRPVAQIPSGAHITGIVTLVTDTHTYVNIGATVSGRSYFPDASDPPRSR